MSRNENAKPRWGALYVLFGVGVGLLGLLEATVPPGPARQTLQIAVSLAMFGAVAIWVRLNRVEIDRASARVPVAVAPPRPPSLTLMRTDAQLVTDLKARLRQTGRAVDSDLLVDAHNGVIWLGGPVDSAKRKTAIETVASSIEGCRGVRSHLFARSRRRLAAE